jgi:Glycosyl transferases group 1/Glycosyltransferase Family 4
VRTLHLDTGREMGGGQWQVVYLLEGLKDATLLARRGSPLFLEASQRAIDVRPASYLELRSQARKYDLIHAHDARAHTMAAIVGGAPLVVSRRVAFPVKRGFFSLWKYANAALYLAVSKFVAARLMDAGVRGAKIRVAHDGVPIPEAGTPVPGRVAMLRGKAADIPGIPVHWADNFWQDLSTACIFVYASELEGLGSAAIAAMACGVPVVACGAGGLSEVIEHGVTGLLVERAELGSAVRKLLDDPQLAARMGLRGRERAVDRFSVDAMRAATMRAYKEVLAK